MEILKSFEKHNNGREMYVTDWWRVPSGGYNYLTYTPTEEKAGFMKAASNDNIHLHEWFQSYWLDGYLYCEETERERDG